MHEHVKALTGGLVSVDHDLAREFDERLAESSTLAFRVAYAVLRRREDAEDVAQDAFLRAYGRFHQLRDRTRFRAWLVRTTWRLAIDRIRGERRRSQREHDADAIPLAALPGEAPATHLRRVELWAAIDALPPKLRMAIVLAGLEGHNLREVARLLDVPEGTVKSRLFLARKRLRELLG